MTTRVRATVGVRVMMVRGGRVRLILVMNIAVLIPVASPSNTASCALKARLRFRVRARLTRPRSQRRDHPANRPSAAVLSSEEGRGAFGVAPGHPLRPWIQRGDPPCQPPLSLRP